MTLAWNALGFTSVVVSLAALALAVVVLVVRPTAVQNRLLALALLFEAAFLVGGVGLIYLTDAPASVYAYQVTTALSAPAFLAAYLALVGTLRTPLARPFASGRARRGLAAGIVLLAVLVLVAPDRFVRGVIPAENAPYDAVLGSWLGVYPLVNVTVVTYALVASFDTWRRAAPGTLARTQAAYFLAAFGLRDLFVAMQRGRFTLNSLLGTELETPFDLAARLAGVDVAFWLPLQLVLFVALVGYAMLKAQLFDIDLKIKFAIQRSTVVATFAVAFLVVSELVERVLGVEGALFGIAAAVVVGLVFRRVERLAGGLADHLMPGVEDSTEYRTVRRREVYQAALEEALVDGALTPKDRAVLAALRDHLGLTATEVDELERRATSAP